MSEQRRMLPAALGRGAGFFVFWLMLAGAAPSDLPVGVIAAVLASWCSLSLLPPAARAPSLAGVARLVWRFPRQALVAGLDVALRALDPAMPLRPGFVTFSPTLPPGAARDGFCAYVSLLPGAVPLGTDDTGALIFHCVDVGQPVAGQLAVEETLFRRALGLGDG